MTRPCRSEDRDERISAMMSVRFAASSHPLTRFVERGALNAATQPRTHAFSSGLSCCSKVGTSSATVGWMCMVREMAM